MQVCRCSLFAFYKYSGLDSLYALGELELTAREERQQGHRRLCGISRVMSGGSYTLRCSLLFLLPENCGFVVSSVPSLLGGSPYSNRHTLLTHIKKIEKNHGDVP